MGHTFTKLVYHCIFSTKGRRAFINETIRERLYSYIRGILERSEAHPLAIGGVAGHVHLLIEIAPTVSVANMMRLVKTNSSKWVHETFPMHREFAWQSGYGAFSVSSSAVPDVIRYIDNQAEHHRSRRFEDEFVEFLRRHGLDCDERYVWD
ncbi:MAG: IS200/IS605 family transposase [Planctomycetes bacterium]|nr:IS200/IS605 family transposase [Planctomycetota bacterium]